MPQAMHRPHLSPHLTLNTDGRAHPRENALTLATLVCALVALGCAPFSSAHIVGAWVGVVGTVVGLYGQLVSATTAERWLIVVGIGGSFVGAGLNMAHGGLF